MLHKIEGRGEVTYTFKIWQGEESLEYEIIGSPIIGDQWITIRTLKTEIHFNIAQIDRFEFFE